MTARSWSPRLVLMIAIVIAICLPPALARADIREFRYEADCGDARTSVDHATLKASTGELVEFHSTIGRRAATKGESPDQPTARISTGGLFRATGPAAQYFFKMSVAFLDSDGKLIWTYGSAWQPIDHKEWKTKSELVRVPKSILAKIKRDALVLYVSDSKVD